MFLTIAFSAVDFPDAENFLDALTISSTILRVCMQSQARDWDKGYRERKLSSKLLPRQGIDLSHNKIVLSPCGNSEMEQATWTRNSLPHACWLQNRSSAAHPALWKKAFRSTHPNGGSRTINSSIVLTFLTSIWDEIFQENNCWARTEVDERNQKNPFGNMKWELHETLGRGKVGGSTKASRKNTWQVSAHKRIKAEFYQCGRERRNCKEGIMWGSRGRQNLAH